MQTHTLTYVQPLFLEEQRARDVYPRASILLPALALVLFVGVVSARLLLPGRVAIGLLPGLLIVTAMFTVMATLAWFCTSTTIVETTMIQLRLSILGRRVWSRTIPMHRVRKVDLTTSTEQRSALKMGVGEVFFMTRKTSVRVHLPEFNYLLIGSSTPEKLRDAIESALSGAPDTGAANDRHLADAHRAEPSASP